MKRLLILIVACAILTPHLASAQTLEEQLAALLAQVKALQTVTDQPETIQAKKTNSAQEKREAKKAERQRKEQERKDKKIAKEKARGEKESAKEARRKLNDIRKAIIRFETIGTDCTYHSGPNMSYWTGDADGEKYGGNRFEGSDCSKLQKEKLAKLRTTQFDLENESDR